MEKVEFIITPIPDKEKFVLNMVCIVGEKQHILETYSISEIVKGNIDDNFIKRRVNELGKIISDYLKSEGGVPLNETNKGTN